MKIVFVKLPLHLNETELRMKKIESSSINIFFENKILCVKDLKINSYISESLNFQVEN
jgi:hypothetical protein